VNKKNARRNLARTEHAFNAKVSNAGCHVKPFRGFKFWGYNN